MASDEERRAAPRTPIELRVEYKKLNTFFADYTKNLCQGGTFIRTTKPLPIGTEFVFRLVVPRMAEPLVIRGEVRWVKRAGEAAPEGAGEGEGEIDPEPGMGIRFLYQSDDERAAVGNAVEKLMIDSLGPRLFAHLMGRQKP
jgi:type IV pilus assembly protein PilZ